MCVLLQVTIFCIVHCTNKHSYKQKKPKECLQQRTRGAHNVADALLLECSLWVDLKSVQPFQYLSNMSEILTADVSLSITKHHASQ